MIVREITEQSEWESFLQTCDNKTFLHSFAWSVFSKRMGHTVWRLGVEHEGKLVAAALVVKIRARRGTFLFIPHGPVGSAKPTVITELTGHLEVLGEREGASFIRVASLFDRAPENKAVFRALGYREAPMHMHPETTWELNVRPAEEELLQNMRKTTRNLIRRAMREGELTVRKETSKEGLVAFQKLYGDTATRHHFVPFSKKYLTQEFELFSKDDNVVIFLAEYKGEVVAAAIVIYWQQIAFYHHGASHHQFGKLPTSYLLQWEAIREAKRRGCAVYNFWGIADEDSRLDEKHAWVGVTLFKKGFGGYQRTLLKTQDKPLSPLYWVNFAIESIRRLKRHV